MLLINDNKLPVKVLLTFREDYFAKLTPFFQRCPNLPDHYLRLVALNGEQVYQAIRRPFEDFPGYFRPEISAKLAAKIRDQFEMRSGGGDIRLTEVQIVCRSLIESNKPDTEKVFDDSGGVQGILENYLEHSVKSLESAQQGPAIALLGRMVTSAGTRNVISQDDLCWRVETEERIARPLLEGTLDSLEQKAKLIRRERRRDVYYYEIASEFLVPWIRKKILEREEREKLKEVELRADQERQRADEHARQAEDFRQLLTLTVAWSPDGRLLAAGRLDGSVEVWDVTFQRLVLRLAGHTGSVTSLAWSPDGHLLATVSEDHTVKIWDPTSGRELRTLTGHTDRVCRVAWSPDGQLLASASWDCTVKIWDMTGRSGPRTLIGHSAPVLSVDWSPSGDRLATLAQDGSFMIWDAGPILFEGH